MSDELRAGTARVTITPPVGLHLQGYNRGRPSEGIRDELYARLSSRATAQHRTDDTPEVIANRLDVYDEQTRPVISYYEDRGLVKRVNGVGRVKDITTRLRDALDNGS